MTRQRHSQLLSNNGNILASIIATYKMLKQINGKLLSVPVLGHIF